MSVWVFCSRRTGCPRCGFGAGVGINPNTVVKTYQELEDEGILVTEPKKGFFVSDQNVHSILSLRQKEEFRKAVIRCQETGISEDDAQKIVREVYEGKQG